MATIEQALYYEVVNDAGVSALISTRLYPAAEVPQDTTTPYMTYQRISGPRHRHQGGAGLVEARYQFTCHDDTQREAAALATALRAVLEAYRGDMGESGSTVTVRAAYVENDVDGSSPPTDASQRGPIWQSVDVLVWYVE